MVFEQRVITESGIGDLASHYEKPVRFSLCHCNYSGSFCLSKIKEKEDRKALYRKLGHFEKMTWKQASNMAREEGISVEKRSTTNYTRFSPEVISLGFPNPTIGHFRYGENLGRIFGFMKNGLFYILKVDNGGTINH